MRRAQMTASMETLQPGKGHAPPFLLTVEAQRGAICGFCGGSLEGMRRDARYCCASHRALASKQRRAA